MGRTMSMDDQEPAACCRASVRRELVPVVQALEKGLRGRLVAVVLFGSRARGDAREESDWDMLVIARDLPWRHIERYREIKSILPPIWRGRVSILAKTPDEFEAHLPVIYLEIALDGLILYDSEEFAGSRLERLRCLIHALDLRRVERGKELVWQWGRFPGLGWSLAWEEAA